MKRNLLSIVSLAVAVVFMVIPPAHAAKHTKEEVNRLITETQGKLDAIIHGDTASLVSYEISKIKDQLSSAAKLMTDGKVDQAFIDIKIGMCYFDMIDARIDLYRSNLELEETKKKIAAGEQ